MKKALLAGAPLTVLAVAAALIPAAQPPSTPMSASAVAAPVALTGEVFTADPRQQIKVTAVAWPNQETLDALPVGATVPLVPLTDVTVSGNSYTVRADPAKLPATHLTDHGQLDIEVVATPPTGLEDVYNESVSRGDNAWRRSPAATGLTQQLAGGLAVGLLPISERATLPGALVVGQPDAEAGSVLLPASNLTAPGISLGNSDFELSSLSMEPICSTGKTSETTINRAKIGDVMPSANYMKGKVSYRIGSSHSLGVGIKHPTGSYEESGTLTRSSDEQVDPVFTTENHTAKTSWRYRDYKNSCTQRISRRPEAHTGGYWTPSRSHPDYYDYCRYYAPMTWSTSSAKAWTYQHGVTLWGVLNVNAQTGYNEDVTVSYRFLERGRTLCGNNEYPPSAQLVAGK